MAEIWECRCRYRLLNTDPEECAENTWTFLLPAGMPSFEGFRDAMAQSWAPIVHQMFIDVMWEGVIVRRFEPTSTPLMHLRFDTPIPGEVGGVVFPTSTAVEVLRDTGNMGRDARGRLFIPWLTNTLTDTIPHNEINEDGAAAILGALDDFMYLIQGHNAAGVLAIPIVYSRRSAAGGTRAYQITGYRVQRALRTLAKRSRHRGPCPPFPDDRPLSGGMGLGTDLGKWGGNTRIIRLNSQWKYRALSLGNGLGNAEEPEGWYLPEYDASSWNDQLHSYTPSPPVYVPGTFTTTDCVPGDGIRYGIVNPDFWEAPPDLGTAWSPTHAEFQLPHWVLPPGADTSYKRIPRDGHILLRTRFKPAFDGVLLTCSITFIAIDSVCIWFNGEEVVNQVDGEWIYPSFPAWQTISLPLNPDITEQTLAIRVRSHHTPPASVDPCSDPDQNYSYRQWHIYGDCNCYDALCLPSVFCFYYDQFQRAYAYLGFQLRAEWIEPPPPPDAQSSAPAEIGVG